MRDHSKVVPAFWTSSTGKAIRRLENTTLRLSCWTVAMYLITNRHANMLGLYEIPLPFLAHETGLDLSLTSAALKELERLDFCRYDDETEFVWIRAMARFQIFGKDEAELKEADNRVKSVRNHYAAMPSNPFLGPFFDEYAQALHLTEKRGTGQQALPLGEPTRSPSGGASEGAIKEDGEPPSKPRAGAGAGERARDDSATPRSVVTPPACYIPLVHKTSKGEPETYTVSREQVARWSETYPGVDVLFELRKLREWNEANPTRRKTRRGILAHIIRWLSSAQDSGRSQPPKAPPPAGGSSKPAKDGDAERLGAARADLNYWGLDLARQEGESVDAFIKRANKAVADHIGAGGKPAKYDPGENHDDDKQA